VTPEIQERLAAFLQRLHGVPVTIEGLRLLTGGASRQTWSFDAVLQREGGPETLALVARCDPRKGPNVMSREVEYRVLEAAGLAGVPAPKVHAMGDDSLGVRFFLMERIDGQTISRRILRDLEFTDARRALPRQLGEALAAIHRIPIDGELGTVLASPEPGLSPAATELKRFESTYRAITPDPHPAFELAFRWLKRNIPQAGDVTLVHGDFRMGNFIVGPDGLQSVLDWELAHIGDPMEDLGWICVRSWRFGNDHLPVGGVGDQEGFFTAYEAAGGRAVDRHTVRWWETFGNLRWGIICIMQAQAYLGGMSKSVELAAIGRRTAETEWELLNLIAAEEEAAA
jgi:aminoglycoside phosphotransferase (APT) family kinase protein